MKRFFMNTLGRPSVLALLSVLVFSASAMAGTLSPSASPASTMRTLAEIYNAIAGTFDSSSITANQNGSLLETLKYMENQVPWASSSNNIWNLNSGNVGIGTSSLDAKFEVSGVASVSSLLIGGSAPRLVTSNSLDFDEFAASMTLDTDTTISSNGYALTLGNASVSGSFEVGSGGFWTDGTNVGVGTSAPFSRFSVVSPGATLVGQISTDASTGTGRLTAVQGRYLYTLNTTTLSFQIIDISKPDSPELISTLPLTITGLTSINVQGDYAYINSSGAGLGIVNISNPASPSLQSVANFSGGCGSSGCNNDTEIQGKYIYTGGSLQAGHFAIAEISNPRTLREVFHASFIGASPTKLALQGKYAYLSNSSALLIYDITNSAGPILRYSSISSAFGNMVVQGRYGYSQVSSGFRVVDVSNPSAPVTVGINASLTTATSRLLVHGRFVYEVVSGFLHVIDISDPTNPTVVNSLPITGSGSLPVIQGRYLYLKSGDVIYVYDLNGGYIQQLEVGNLESSTIVARDGFQVVGNADIVGGFSVAGAALLSGPFTSAGSSSLGLLGNVGIGTLVTPAKFSVLGSAGNYDIFNVASASGTSVLRIAKNGFIGINDSTPTTTLDVTGNASISGNFELGSNGFFWNGTNVGIGTSRPDAKLEVVGTASVSGSGYFGGNVGIGALPSSVNQLLVSTTAAATYSQVEIAGTYTLPGDNDPSAVRVTSTIAPGANTGRSAYGIWAAPTLNEASSGVHPLFATMRLDAPTISAGSATMTNAATLYVSGAPSATVTGGNYAVYSAGGTNYFNGNIGIGATSVDAKLEVNGTASISNSLYVISGGNVGIGTSTPGFPLDVNGDIGLRSGGQVDFADETGDKLYLYSSVYGLGVDSNDFVSWSDVDFTWRSDSRTGNILAKLNQNSDNPIFEVRSPLAGGTSNYARLSLSPHSSYAVADAPYIQAYNSGTNDGGLAFGTYNSGLAERMRIAFDGNVGIGATTPEQKLTVVGNILASTSGNVDFTLRSSTTNGATNNDDSQFTLRTGSTSERFDIINGAGAKLFSIASAGNVGIGTTSPRAQVDLGVRAPVRVASISAGTTPRFMHIQGNYAYISNDNASSFGIYDVSNPVVPVLVSSGSFGASSTGANIIVQGGIAYVTYASAYVQLIDVSRPTSPQLLFTTGFHQNVRGLFLQGKYLYIIGSGGSASGFIIYDVSNPRAPRQISTLPSVTGNTVIVEGRYAYIAGTTGSTNPIFQVVDVGDPANPRALSQSGITLFNSGGTMAMQGKYAFVAYNKTGTRQIVTYDISNPASPSAVAFLDLSTSSATRIEAHGGYLYTAVGNSLNLIDIAIPTSPRIVASVSFGSSGANDIEVRGRYLYAVGATLNALQVWDLGGAYLQNLEGGSVAAHSLSVRNNTQIFGNTDISGGLIVGAGAYFRGPFSIYASRSASFGVDTGGNVNIGSSSSTIKLSVRGTSSYDLFNVASASGTSLFRISKSGFVGIGTSTPTTTLDVAGSASISGSFEVGTSGFWTNGTNVGIGTSTPKGKLTVAGTSAEIIASGSSYPALVLNATNATNGTEGLFKIQAQSTEESLRFLNGAGSYLMTIASGGNVGIGSSAPTAKLSLGTSAGAAALHIYQGGAGSNYGMGIQFSNNYQFFTANGTFFTFNGGGNLQTVGAYEMMRVSATGVGIGVTSPAARLDVKGSQSTDPFNVASASGTSILRVSKGGNVGINDSTPTTTLDVAGNASVSGRFELAVSGLPTLSSDAPNSITGLRVAGSVDNTYSALMTIQHTSPAGGTPYSRNLLRIYGDVQSDGDSSDSNKIFYVGNTSSYTTAQATVYMYGRVGVGTMTPATLFDVTASVGANVDLFNVSSVSGTSFLRINKSGNVGINDSTPTTTLDVAGSASISGSFEVGTSGFWTNGTNVGIGNNRPDQKLDVAGNITASTSGNVDIIIRSSTPTDDGGKFTLRSAGGSDRFDILGTVPSGTGAEYTPRFSIASSGFAGIYIGHNSGFEAVPSAVFQIQNGGTGFGGAVTDRPSLLVNAVSAPATSADAVVKITSAFDNTGATLLKVGVNSGGGGSPHAGTLLSVFGDVHSDGVDTDVNNVFKIANGTGAAYFYGNVGMGTLSPVARLDVRSSISGNYDLLNVASSSGTSFLRVTKGGNVGIGTTTPTSKLQIVGGDCADDAGGGGCTADYAEFYPSTEDMQKGDLVMIDTATTSYAVKKATSAGVAIGIVSTNPAITIDGGSLSLFSNAYVLNPRKPAIALKGRVPLKVIGTIAPGDWLAASDTPGYAQKATTAGMVVGIALEASQDGKVLTFVSPTWWSPTTQGESLVSIDAPTMSNIFSAMIQMFADVLHITFTDGLVKMRSVELETGATIKDKATGQPYCVQVEYGQLVTSSGACGSGAVATPTPSPTPEVIPTPEVTLTPTPTPEVAPTPTPTPEAEPTPTPTPTPEPTPIPTPEPTPEVTPEPVL